MTSPITPSILRRRSFAGRVLLLSFVLVSSITLATIFLTQHLSPWWLAWVMALLLSTPLLVLGVHLLVSPLTATMTAVRNGTESLRDSDFSASIANTRNDELGQLIEAHNQLGDALRVERQTLYQRELVLDTVIQTTDIALLLANTAGVVVYSNTAARQLMRNGRPINGESVTTLLSDMPKAFRDAVAGGDGLFTLEGDEPQTYHLSRNEFMLNAQRHQMFLFKQLTQELSRQEVSTWKKVIRLISHELNNSLAPISSLAHSGKRIVQKTDSDAQLVTVLETIGERATHLKDFIEGYARFARLPNPRPVRINWSEFLTSLAATQPFTLVGEPPESGWSFDAAQMEQVMINLLKNARESGSPADAIRVSVQQIDNKALIEVTDQGGGISDDIMQHALLPFYSTKITGTGLGLPLCREIVEAHGGRLALANIENGLQVRISLPYIESVEQNQVSNTDSNVSNSG